MRSDSPEAQEWPTRKPSAAIRRAKSELVRTGAEIGKVAIPAALGVAVTGAKKIGTAARAATTAARVALGATATVSTATVAAVAAAFAAGYAIGTGLVKLWQYMQPEERDYRKALAFREARKRWVTEHGREMLPEEVRAMGRGFLESLHAQGLAPSQR